MKQYNLETRDGVEVLVVNHEYEKKIKQAKFNLFLKNSGIPNFYWNIEFDDYKGNSSSIALKKIRYYAAHCHEPDFDYVHLFLYGARSTQKTALACNILKTAMHNGLKAKFVLSGQLIDKLMKIQGFKIDEDLYYEIKKLKEADIIVIDDIFDPQKSLLWKNSENKNMIISEWDTFLRDVLSSKTRVIMTSNYSVEIIKQHYGEDLFELVDRNTEKIMLTDNIKSTRKLKVNSVFKDIK